MSNITMMVNAMLQLDWALGCPDSQLNIFLGMSVRVPLDAINIEICRVKQTALPDVSGPHLICWKPERQRKGEFILFPCLQAGTLVFCLWTRTKTHPDLDSDSD